MTIIGLAILTALWLAVFFLNHRGELKTKLPILLLGSAAIWLVVFLFIRRVSAASIMQSVGLFCVLDNLYLLLSQRKK